MEDEAWRSVTIVENREGRPHVLQQKVTVYTDGMGVEAAGYVKPEEEHRLVPVKDLVDL